MDDPIRSRAEQLGAWSELSSWCGAGLWWSVPPRSATGAAGGSGRHRRRQPLHERAPLSQREARTLMELEAALDGSSRGAPRAARRAPRLLIIVLVLLLAAALPVTGTAATALGLIALVAAAATVAWVREGVPSPGRPEGRT